MEKYRVLAIRLVAQMEDRHCIAAVGVSVEPSRVFSRNAFLVLLGVRAIKADVALADVALRILGAFGPATVADVNWPHFMFYAHLPNLSAIGTAIASPSA